MSESTNAALLSVADARIDSFLRLAFADSSCANCKVIYEQFLILYGSYARGVFRADSDIDIMILVDLSDQEIMEKGRILSDMTFEYNYGNDLTIMPIVKNSDHFNKWLRAYPFYYHIKKEGTELYAA